MLNCTLLDENYYLILGHHFNFRRKVACSHFLHEISMLLQRGFITFHDKVECFVEYLPFSALNLVECFTYYIILNKHLIFGSFPLLILINAFKYKFTRSSSLKWDAELWRVWTPNWPAFKNFLSFMCLWSTFSASFSNFDPWSRGWSDWNFEEIWSGRVITLASF